MDKTQNIIQTNKKLNEALRKCYLETKGETRYFKENTQWIL